MRESIFFTSFMIFLIVAGKVYGGEDLAAKVKENCRIKWTDDYQMQKYCVDNQMKAWAKISEMMNRFPEGSEEQNIIGRCAGKWPGKTGGFDFEMVVYCTENQLKAYRSLQ